jgi:acyl-CoA reductase-like NAD-dependent aldehyde dehydrogenase
VFTTISFTHRRNKTGHNIYIGGKNVSDYKMLHEKVHDEFVAKYIAAFKKVVVGEPLNETTQMGPVASESHRDKVEDYIRSAIHDGATLALGNLRPLPKPLDKGTTLCQQY